VTNTGAMTAPANFFRLLNATQEERDLTPCVAPKDTHHTWVALLRGGDITGPIAFIDHGGITTCLGEDYKWKPNGSNYEGIAVFDIIATLDLTAVGAKLVRLQSAVETARDTFQWYGDMHAAKPDETKAQRNYTLAAQMAAALEVNT
jgi:hypothetical protein